MSYDISLVAPGTHKPVTVNRQTEGGTIVLGGTTDASLNVTYNYAPHFYEQIDKDKGIRWLYGKTGAETIDRLAAAVAVLGTKRDRDYWKNTPGNAGHALSVLLAWARAHPEGVWEGD